MLTWSFFFLSIDVAFSFWRKNLDLEIVIPLYITPRNLNTFHVFIMNILKIAYEFSKLKRPSELLGHKL